MHGIHFYAVPVLLAAVVMWLIGALWYGVAFRKRWVALVEHTGEVGPGRPAFEMISSFLLSIVLCFILTNLIDGLSTMLWGGHPNFKVGYSVGIMCWFGFIAPAMLTQSLYERRPARLFAINAGYWIVAMAFAGGVAAIMMK